MTPDPEHDAFVNPFHGTQYSDIWTGEEVPSSEIPMESLAAFIVDLLFGILELIWLVLVKFLPATFYFTSIVLVPAVTIGRVVVAYPKKADAPYRSWQKSPQGRIILSPVLGNVFGFSFWVIVAVLVLIRYQHV